MDVFVNGRFLTQAVTGVQRYAACLLRAMDRVLDGRDGPRVTLLYPPSAISEPPFHHVRVRRVGWRTGQLWEQLDLPRHAGAGALVSLCNTAPVAHRRQIVTIHDASVYAAPEAYSLMFRSWYRFLHAQLGRRATFIVTDSEFSAGELSRRVGIPADKLRVVLLGAEHVLEYTADHTVLDRFGVREPFVLGVASQSPHKNFSAVVEAVRRLALDDFDVVIAGGTNPRVFGAPARFDGSGVKFVGYVSDGELRALYERAACFVYPSRYEGFGLPPLEAMACGCPVVVSREASLPEVCGDAALYCDWSDPGDIAKRITQVVRDRDLAERLRTMGRDRSRRFTWERSARALLDVLREAEARWNA